MHIVPQPAALLQANYHRLSVENNLSLVWYFSAIALLVFGVHLLHHLRLGINIFNVDMLPYTVAYSINFLYAAFNLRVLRKTQKTAGLGKFLIMFELAYPYFLATVATLLAIFTSQQGLGPVPFVMAMLIISIVLQGQYLALLSLLIICWVSLTLGLYLVMPIEQAIPPIISGFTTILIAAGLGRLAEQLRVKQFEIIGELANKNKLLQKLSIEDPLTNLYNRRHFKAKLHEETMCSQRSSYPLGLLIIDIDDFKFINDSAGHVEGDKVLIQTAQFITAEIREVDVVCRYGGDEFVVLLVDASISASLKIAKRICNRVSQHKFNSLDTQVTVSIGHAQYNGQSMDEFLQQADKMLYISKNLGKNKVSSASDV